MTNIYFVRHAQSDHTWEDDRSRPLTESGFTDSRRVTEVLSKVKVEGFYSSPYIRSIDTIRESAYWHGKVILVDERFRERENGFCKNNYEMIRRRWRDFDFHEEGGESLAMVQKRNIEALMEVLKEHPDEPIVIGTHGTALSTILNYFDPAFGCDDFFRIINSMPYIIRLDFIGNCCVAKEELLNVEKDFPGKA